ncbi:MAG: DoxX family membrane protein [Candidatus Marinimicrobia bacterium]|nr:DoxX family membrane protein [Candidatus Neomarinimicrobiota bacterium]
MNSTFHHLLESKFGKLLLLLLQMGLGLLFILASLDKIWNPGLFAKAIANYQILPLPLLHITAIILPWIEMLSGLALVFNRYPRAANLIIGSMTLVFTLAIGSAMLRGLDFNCGCFSVTSTETTMGSLKIIQNIGILGVSWLLEYRHWLTPGRQDH